MRLAYSFGSIAVAASLAACGGGGHHADAGVADGGPDGMAADATTSDAGGPVGLWKLETLTMPLQTDDGGIAVTTVNTTGTMIDGTETARANGTLELSPDGQIAVVAELVRGTRLWQRGIEGSIDSYTFGGGFGSIMPAHLNPATATWTHAPEKLEVSYDATLSATFLKYTPTDNETIELKGLALVGNDDPGNLVPLTHPRVATVYLLRKAGGGTTFFEVPGQDKPLAGFGTAEGQSQAFDLSQTEGALGVERIVYGTAFLAMALVVVYDDVDNDQQLTVLYGSCGAGMDCVRGVSDLVLAYRVGHSPELAASQYSWLIKGWSWAFTAMDYTQTPPRLGLVPVAGAPDVPSVPADVTVFEDPTNVIVPQLNFD